MHRAAVVIVLGIALAFASLPGVIGLSFAGGSPLADDVASRLEIASGSVTVGDVPQSLTMGATDPADCPRISGPDASQF